MSDPLSLVRNATINKIEIKNIDGKYIFNNNIQLPETTKTSFRRTLKSNEYYYTLKDIIFYLNNINSNLADYRRKAVESRITAIVEHDRLSLKDYLYGVIDTCPQIDLYANNTISKDTVSAINVTNAAPSDAIVELSSEELKEKRAVHSSNIDQALQNIKQNLDITPSERKSSLKRKVGALLSSSDENNNYVSDITVDKDFVDADKILLSKLKDNTIATHTCTSILEARHQDFAFALKLFNDKVLKKLQTTTTAGNSNNKDSRNKLPQQKAAHSSTEEKAIIRTPIIIVPKSLTSIITLLNVKDFLIDGEYVSNDTKRNSNNKKDKEVYITCKNNIPEQYNRTYKIIDDGSQLSVTDWDRVVAVFTTGQEWQFKDYKNNYNNPVLLFNNVLGVYITLEGNTIPNIITSWNCKILKLNIYKQHINASVSREFWTLLNEFMKVNKAKILQHRIKQK